jgi:hypothetical protein
MEFGKMTERWISISHWGMFDPDRRQTVFER